MIIYKIVWWLILFVFIIGISIIVGNLIAELITYIKKKKIEKQVKKEVILHVTLTKEDCLGITKTYTFVAPNLTKCIQTVLLYVKVHNYKICEIELD